MSLQAFRSDQRGIAIVETVIALPVLLLILLVVAEFTNAFIQHNTLTKLVRDGARFVAEDAYVGVSNILDQNRFDDGRSIVVYGNTSGAGTPLMQGLALNQVAASMVAPQIIEVSANYPYTGILGTILPGLTGGGDTSLSFNLVATVSMRAIN